MRSVSRRTRRGGAVLLLVAALAVPAAYAEDGSANPFDPPEARVRPPIGLVSTEDEPSFFSSFFAWLVELQARVRPPVG